MATTNIDAVAEFKSPDQRLSGGVRARGRRPDAGGHQERHAGVPRLGLLVRTPLGMERQHLAEQPRDARDPAGRDLAQRLRLHDRRAGLLPGFNQTRNAVLLLEPGVAAAHNPAGVRQDRVPTALERRGDFSQSVDSSGNPFPYIRDYTPGLPCSAADTRGCFQDGGVLGRIPANRLYAPGLNALNIFPTANFSGGSGLNFTSQDPNSSPRREDLLRMDFQATDNWRITGRYMKNKEDILQAYGTTWAGNGSDQLPTPVLFVHPGSNYMLSATGVVELHDVARGELGPRGQLARTTSSRTRTCSARRQESPRCRCCSRMRVQADYIPGFRLPRRPHGQRRPLPDRSRPVHQREHHARRHREPDEGLGLARVEGRLLLPEQLQAAEHLRQLQQPDQLHRQREQPVRHGLSATRTRRPACSTATRRPPSTRCPNGVTRTSSGTRRTTGSRSRLTLDYGVRFYYLTPQWDTTLQASNFLPDQFNAGAPRSSTRRCASASSPCRATPGEGWIRRSSPQV